MNSRTRRWLTAITGIVLAADGALLWLWIECDNWIAVGLLGAVMAVVAVYLVRLIRVLAGQVTSFQSVALIMLAPLLPRREARAWLPELEGQLLEVRPDSSRWRAIRSDAVRSMPELMRMAWGGWLRDGLVGAAVRYARPRVAAIDRFQRSPCRPWPADARHTRRIRRRLRRLRRCARLVAWSAGRYQEHEVVGQARTLVDLCTQARRHIGDSAHLDLPTAKAVALLLEINHITMVLATAMVGYRRGPRC